MIEEKGILGDNPKSPEIVNRFISHRDDFINKTIRTKAGYLTIYNILKTDEKRIKFEMQDEHGGIYGLEISPGGSRVYGAAGNNDVLFHMLLVVGKIHAPEDPIERAKLSLLGADDVLRVVITDIKTGKTMPHALELTEDGFTSISAVETAEGIKTITTTGDSPESVIKGLEKGLRDLETQIIGFSEFVEKQEEKTKASISLMIKGKRVPDSLTTIYGGPIDIENIEDVEALNKDLKFVLETEEKEDHESDAEFKERVESRIKSAINKHMKVKKKPITLNLRNRKKNLQGIAEKYEKMVAKKGGKFVPKKGGAWIDQKTGKIHTVQTDPDRKKGDPVMVGMKNPFYSMD